MITKIIKDPTIEGQNKWTYIFDSLESLEAWESDQLDVFFRTKTEAREYMQGMKFNGIQWQYVPG